MREGRSLWRGSAPLVLASTSATRRLLLENAGVGVETQSPGVDERALETAGREAYDIARRLAVEKALAVSRLRPDRLVLGADQTLICEGRLFHKPADRADAHAQLGIHLFERIEGDHSTILGLPLIPLLAALRTKGLLVF